MKSNILILWSLLWAWSLSAQDLLLKGKVVYANNSQGVPFAYIQLKGVALGTVCDQNGSFSLKIPEIHRAGSLVFSYMGYKKQEIALAKIAEPQNLLIRLVEEVGQLSEVIVRSRRKETNPRRVLNRVIENIPQNYADKPVYLEAYAREALKENGVAIHYADAACKIKYGAYEGKVYKFSDYYKARQATGIDMGNFYSIISFGNWEERLHDHFTNRFQEQTLATDQVEIIEARASENLSQENFLAKIEGGPLGIISKDLLRYLNWFLNKKEFKKYIYQITEIRDKEGKEWILLTFLPKKAPASDEYINETLAKKKRISRTDILSGEMYIDPETYAVSKIHFSVSPPFKKMICNIRKRGIQHFGYEISLDYQLIGKKWYLKKIVRNDEFLKEDTTQIHSKITPYQAISELYINQVITEKVEKLKGENVYNGLNVVELMDTPLGYNSQFWLDYAKKYPFSAIPDSLKTDLEALKPLEKQFVSRVTRDTTLKAPIAPIIPQSSQLFGQTLTDNYAWLKDVKNPRKNAEVMKYLEAENKFTENYFIPLRRTQRGFYNQLIARIERKTESLPVFDNGYYYFTQYAEDQEYPIIYRMKDSTRHEEKELLFDVNKMAEGKDFYALSGYYVSPDNQVVAYSENLTGGAETMTYFKDLRTGQLLSDSLLNIGNMVWLNDNQHLYYTLLSPQSFRSYRVMRHQLGTSQAQDVLIYEENDPLFSLAISKTLQKELIFMSIHSSESSEVYFKSTDKVDEPFKIIQAREPGHRYSAGYFEGKLLIISNKNAMNYRILETPLDKPSAKNWVELIAHQPDVMIENFHRFADYWVIQEKANAQSRLKVIDIKNNKSHYIEFEEEIYSCQIGYNPDPKTKIVRLTYSSFAQPTITYDYDMENKTKKVIKRQKVNGFFFERAYKTERIFAPAPDGTLIPITLIYNKFRFNKEGKNKLWLTGYGAYGISMEVGFSHAILTLIDNGFVYAIAHVRGGDDCGQNWYKQGKLLNKQNTFTDFIACAEHLINQKYTTTGRLVAEGVSAGGLLMGAVANMRPDLFHTIILDVPFVDVINTMLDETLPLTTGEYNEWGNPQERKYFNYMRQYSPYDNVKAQNYPNLLFFTALNDKNVGYWEATKMVAKLRATKTDNNLLLLQCNMSAGHGGASGRFNSLRELAWKYTLIFDLLNNGKEIKE